MKKIITLLVVLVSMNYCAIAQDKPQVNPNAPEIKFESETHDYGTIEYASDGSYSFKFTNTGKDPLIITDAKGSCGCTVPKWPKEPTMKGQSNFIIVTYDTKRPGPFTKTVTLTSNASTPTVILTIKGVVKTQEQSEDLTPVRKSSGMSPMEAPGK